MLVRNGRKAETPLLGLDDLRPCMAFSNLRRIELNTEWNVGLTDSDLPRLAPAWPNLEHLLINEYFGDRVCWTNSVRQSVRLPDVSDCSL